MQTLINTNTNMYELVSTYVVTKEVDYLGQSKFKINHAVILNTNKLDSGFINNETKKELNLSGKVINFNYGLAPIKVLLLDTNTEGEYINEHTNQKIILKSFKENEFFLHRIVLEHQEYFIVLPKGEINLDASLVDDLCYLSIESQNYSDFANNQSIVFISNIQYHIYFSFKFIDNKLKINSSSINLFECYKEYINDHWVKIRVKAKKK